MAKGIWVFIEQRNGQIRKVSLELLSEGRKLADQTEEPLVGVILGENISGLAAQIASYGADKIV